MLRFGVLLICFTTVLAGEQYFGDGLTSHVNFAPAKNLTEFLLENPGMQLLGEMEKDPREQNQYFYRLGYRVNGDQLVAQGSAKQQYSTLHDIAITLTYPREGIGAFVSFIEITVKQSSNLGRYYILSGGLQQRRIQVVIEAYKTLYLEHSTLVFGYGLP